MNELMGQGILRGREMKGMSKSPLPPLLKWVVKRSYALEEKDEGQNPHRLTTYPTRWREHNNMLTFEDHILPFQRRLVQNHMSIAHQILSMI